MNAADDDAGYEVDTRHVSGREDIDSRLRDHTEAFQAAAKRIFRNRRAMTVEDAIDVVRDRAIAAGSVRRSGHALPRGPTLADRATTGTSCIRLVLSR